MSNDDCSCRARERSDDPLGKGWRRHAIQTFKVNHWLDWTLINLGTYLRHYPSGSLSVVIEFRRVHKLFSNHWGRNLDTYISHRFNRRRREYIKIRLWDEKRIRFDIDQGRQVFDLLLCVIILAETRCNDVNMKAQAVSVRTFEYN